MFGSLLRMPRRRMAGKRMFIGVACTICLVLGVYMKFFNHESSDQLLLANRQQVQGDVFIEHAKPKFHRLGAIKKQEDTLNKLTTVHEHDHKLEEQNLKDIADKIQIPFNKDDDRDEVELDKVRHKVIVEEEEEEEEEAKETEEQNHQAIGEIDEERHKVIEEEEDDDDDEPVDEWADGDQEQNPKDVHEDEDKTENDQQLLDKPIERVEGEVEDEDDDVIRDAGGDGGEKVEEEEQEEQEDGAHSIGRGPHGIKTFDWDQWIKENEFVDLGNIWGYCDDDDPPIIGKLILVEDEERGGAKTIFLFNTTIDKDVLMGRVDISIEYNKMHFYTNQFDLSDLEVEGDFFKTPILKGDHYFAREQHISSFAPKGHYYGEVQMMDQTDRVIVCGTMNLHLT